MSDNSLDSLITLGIETSCDETSVAVLCGADRMLSKRRLLAGGDSQTIWRRGARGGRRKHVEIINTVIEGSAS